MRKLDQTVNSRLPQAETFQQGCKMAQVQGPPQTAKHLEAALSKDQCSLTEHLKRHHLSHSYTAQLLEP